MRRTALVVGIGAVVLVAAAGLAAPGGRPGPPAEVGSPPEFSISGSVEPVYPLVESELLLEVTNPMRFPISVIELEVMVQDAPGDCTADNLVVEPVSLPFDIPALGRVTVTTAVRLIDDAADACQGATFPLTYTGTAVQP